MSVTIRDIAERAGVSIGTVSRALKNQRGLSEETRRLVRRVARELGYDDRRLRQGSARRLVFLLHRSHSAFAANPFFADVLHGVEEACREYGAVPTLLSTGPAEPVREQLRLHEPDAVICAGFFDDDVLAQLAELELPMALVDFWLPGWRSVNPDNAEGARTATQHLIDGGRQRIAYLGGSLAQFSIRERERGYRRALFEAGRLADPDLEVLAPPGLGVEEGAAAAMKTLLARRVRPDAVFVYNDAAAMAAMRAALAAGHRVPEDIAFVGFDDIPAAAFAPVPLSTVRMDREALGRRGVDLVMRADELPQETLLPVELVVRHSSAPLR